MNKRCIINHTSFYKNCANIPLIRIKFRKFYKWWNEIFRIVKYGNIYVLNNFYMSSSKQHLFRKRNINYYLARYSNKWWTPYYYKTYSFSFTPITFTIRCSLTYEVIITRSFRCNYDISFRPLLSKSGKLYALISANTYY